MPVHLLPAICISAACITVCDVAGVYLLEHMYIFVCAYRYVHTDMCICVGCVFVSACVFAFVHVYMCEQ